MAGATAAGDISVTGGTAALDGTLQIDAASGFTPTIGQSFQLLTASPGQLSGRFSTLRYGSTLGNGSYVAVAAGVYLTIAYDDAAGTVTLNTVATPPIQTAIPQISPATITIGNIHLGDAGTEALTVTNAAMRPADSLDASVAGVTGGVVATGTIGGLAPSASDATDIRIGIDTSSVGVKNGQATLAFLSDSGGGVVAPLDGQSVAVTGSVFRLASAVVAPVNAFIHVGDPSSFALTVRNADPADGSSETLDAQIAGTSGAVSASRRVDGRAHSGREQRVGIPGFGRDRRRGDVFRHGDAGAGIRRRYRCREPGRARGNNPGDAGGRRDGDSG